MPPNRSLLITIDVEDWQQSTLNPDLEISDRSERYVENLLTLLAEAGKQATMFILGKFAEKFPHLVKRIEREGHEVACHGYGHIQIFKQTPEEFSADVYRSKAFLEDLIGKPVVGYRAPDFSIIQSTLWALKILAELGFEYDASIFPIQGSRYGIQSWPLEPKKVFFENKFLLTEIPASALTLLGRRFPVAGGGYHRLLPYPLIEWCLHKVWEKSPYFVAYCHPYEFASDEFSQIKYPVPTTLFLSQSIGRKGFEKKFRQLIRHPHRLVYQVIPEVSEPISIE